LTVKVQVAFAAKTDPQSFVWVNQPDAAGGSILTRMMVMG